MIFRRKLLHCHHETELQLGYRRYQILCSSVVNEIVFRHLVPWNRVHKTLPFKSYFFGVGVMV